MCPLTLQSLVQAFTEIWLGLVTNSKFINNFLSQSLLSSSAKMQLPVGSTVVNPSIVSVRAVTRSTTFSNNLPGLRILIAPSGFKESLGPEKVADCIEEGLLRVAPEHTYTEKIPLHDGGEGFSRALVARYHGDIKEIEVTGPVGERIDSHYGLIGSDRKTAVLDMAGAAGLRLVPKDRRNPTKTTTYGVGELMKAALDNGCTSIIVGCGDSGTSDGGVGMLQALGVQFLDINGNELPRAAGGASLSQLARISLEKIHPRLKTENKGK
jgi:glycerate kinase